MAVIKHISVKGSNGADALNYVLYKHNEMTGEIISDGRGNPIMREEYYLDGINCEPYSFDAECKEVNDLYGKNQLPGDIKAHHFIISYDPKDSFDYGLTGPKAQQLSMEWADRCLPGFQMIVCTHMDGSNESGNIHTHIMMNSLRKYDTDLTAFGERDIDHKAGYKLHLTEDCLQYMKKELMSICDREGLHQIDLISPAKDRITDKEYRVQQNGKSQLEKQHGIDSGKPEKSVFQTQKQYLREAVMDVASRATSFDSFCMIIKQEYNIMVKENRGRISYMHPDRDKSITGRALGTSYEKESVLQIISSGRPEKVSGKDEEKNTKSFAIETMKDCKKVFEMQSDIHLVVQLQDNAKAQLGVSYENKVTLTHVKMMAETILFIQQNNINNVEELNQALLDAENRCAMINRKISEERDTLQGINTDIHYLGQYLSYKRMYNHYLESIDKGMFIRTHKDEIAEYKQARIYLNQKYNGSSFPKLNDLREYKNLVTKKLERSTEQRRLAVEQKNQLYAAKKNIKTILGDRKTVPERIVSERGYNQVGEYHSI